jgi:hypothetical protein
MTDNVKLSVPLAPENWQTPIPVQCELPVELRTVSKLTVADL